MTLGNLAYLKYWKESTEKDIARYINDSVRMLSIREGSFEISFLPKGKDYKMTSNGNWATDNRQTGKPTRILRKLLISKEFSELDFELFNNQLRAIVESDVEFSIVSGKDITYWYHQDHYEDLNGTLGNSCMRYSEAQCYFGIYEDFAKMLILTKRGKLVGRAILWEIDGKTYMDRVYVNKDHIVDSFITYAKEHGFYYREHQSLLSTGDYQWWVCPDGQMRQLNLRIDVDKEYGHWPYLDTFRYLSVDGVGICRYITTNPENCNKSADDPDGWYSDFEEYPWECYNCGRTYYSDCEDECPEGMYWSEHLEEYICEDCATYSEYLGTYIVRRNSVEVQMDAHNIDDIPLSVVQEEDADDFVQIDGKWYSVNCTLQTVVDFLEKRDADKD
ncbi:MAG: hypothetical protein J6V44_12560 [Methanobrevibacter sp.]|nr:hypothetical protein [Methanobrevibacter sp.]